MPAAGVSEAGRFRDHDPLDDELIERILMDAA